MSWKNNLIAAVLLCAWGAAWAQQAGTEPPGKADVRESKPAAPAKEE